MNKAQAWSIVFVNLRFLDHKHKFSVSVIRVNTYEVSVLSLRGRRQVGLAWRRGFHRRGYKMIRWTDENGSPLQSRKLQGPRCHWHGFLSLCLSPSQRHRHGSPLQSRWVSLSRLSLCLASLSLSHFPFFLSFFLFFSFVFCFLRLVLDCWLESWGFSFFFFFYMGHGLLARWWAKGSWFLEGA